MLRFAAARASSQTRNPRNLYAQANSGSGLLEINILFASPLPPGHGDSGRRQNLRGSRRKYEKLKIKRPLTRGGGAI